MFNLSCYHDHANVGFNFFNVLEIVDNFYDAK
jgi:hypothetical protein